MNGQRVEILVEERSMAVFLEAALPRMLPVGYVFNQNCFVRPHQGKQDLQLAIPKLVRAYARAGNTKLVILHDQDSYDCRQLKAKLIKLVKDTQQELPLLVRIACRELENWYLGDLAAIERLHPATKAAQLVRRRKFREVDRLQGAEEMRRLLSKNFAKSRVAREIVAHMIFEQNTSVSFQAFYTGLQRFLG